MEKKPGGAHPKTCDGKPTKNKDGYDWCPVCGWASGAKEQPRAR